MPTMYWLVVAIALCFCLGALAAARRYYTRPRDPDDPEETMPII